MFLLAKTISLSVDILKDWLRRFLQLNVAVLFA